MVFLFLHMLSKEFLLHLENCLERKILTHHSVSGGDISNAYKLESKDAVFFIKINTGLFASKMFKTEAIGLKTIKDSLAILTPEVHEIGEYNGASYLLMEWITPKSPTSKEMQLFGKQLAELHLNTRDEFGFNIDNFIGSLPQSNKKYDNWLEFYIEERLQPQLEIANSKKLLGQSETPSKNQMKESCQTMFENIKPSLLHGDLWGGNYIFSINGSPYLIDPATYFGHSEVDIAMSKLFGGFDNSFYEAYHQIIPKDTFTNSRIELYQLYYLLVHLNLFGRSYYPSVKHLLTKYFQL